MEIWSQTTWGETTLGELALEQNDLTLSQFMQIYILNHQV